MMLELIELRNKEDGRTYLVETDCYSDDLIRIAKVNADKNGILEYDSFFEQVQDEGNIIQDKSMMIVEF